MGQNISIAIIGVGARGPGFQKVDTFWEACVRGTLPPPSNSRPQSRAAWLKTIDDALADAFLDPSDPWRVDTGLFLATTALEPLAPELADVLNLQGASLDLHTDETSVAAAMAMAADALTLGRARVAVVAAGDGMPPTAEGAQTAFVLRRYDEAIRAQNRVYAVLRGVDCSRRDPLQAIAHTTAATNWEMSTVGLLQAVGFKNVEVLADLGEEGRVMDASLRAPYTGPGAGGLALMRSVLALHHHLLPPTAAALHSEPERPECTSWEGSTLRASTIIRGSLGSYYHVALEGYTAGRGEGSDAAGGGEVEDFALRFVGLDTQDRRQVISALEDLQDETQRVHDTFVHEMSRSHAIFMDAATRTLDTIVEALPTVVFGVAEGRDTELLNSLRASTQVLPSLAEATGLQSMTLEPISAPPTGLVFADLRPGARVAVLDDGAELGHALVAELSRVGFEAELVYALPDSGDAAVILSGARGEVTSKTTTALIHEALTLAQQWAAADIDALVMVMDTGGEFALSGRDSARAPLAPIAGLARTVAAEHPARHVKLIDIERDSRSADNCARRICAELLEGGPTLEVGLRHGGGRTTLARPLLSARLLASTAPGAARATARLVIALGDKRIHPLLESMEAERLGLLQIGGAEAAPGALSTLRSRGTEALFTRVELGETRALVEAIAQLERALGRFTSLYIIDPPPSPATLRDIPESGFDAVFGARIEAYSTALEQMKAAPLEELVVVHGLAGAIGLPGQALAAMTASALDALMMVEAEQRADVRVSAIALPFDPTTVVTPPGGPLALAPRGHTMVLWTPASLEVAERGAARGWRAGVNLNQETSALIEDLPEGLGLALPLEWFVRLAHCVSEGLETGLVCHDLELHTHAPLGHTGFSLTATETTEADVGTTTLRATLLSGATGQAIAVSTLVIGGAVPPPPRPSFRQAAGELSFEAAQWYGDPYLNGVGRRWRVIESIESFGPRGASAIIKGARAMSWQGVWWTDPALIEGALQLVALWAQHVFGERAVASRVERYIRYTASIPSGPIRCRIEALADTSVTHTPAANAVLTAGDGKVIAILDNIQARFHDGGSDHDPEH